MSSVNTYPIAKSIYNDTGIMQDVIIDILPDRVSVFRKHLTEFEYRKKEGKRFTTKILSNTQLLVKRIK